MLRITSIFLLCVSCLQAGSLRLENNTSFPLKAVVQGADGSVLGEVSVAPAKVGSWTDFNDMAIKGKAPARSVTPFTVHWYCSAGDTFSISEQISTGALVRATDGSGKKSCGTDKKDKTGSQK